MLFVFFLPVRLNKFCAGLEITAALFFYFFTMWVIAPHAGGPWRNGVFVAIIGIAAAHVFCRSPVIHRDTRAAAVGVWRRSSFGVTISGAHPSTLDS